MTTDVTTNTNQDLMPVHRHTLSAIQVRITTELPEELRYYVQLRQEKPVSALSLIDIKTYCHQIVTKAFWDYTSTPTDAAVLAFQTMALVEELRHREFQGLTVSEVREAFRKGIRGEYGDFFGMCARSYSKFLKGFAQEEKRGAAMLKYMEAIQAEMKEQEVSPEQKLDRSRTSLKHLFEEYRNTGNLGVCPWAYYNVLVDLIGIELEYGPGKIYRTLEMDQETRDKINAEAEAEYQKELKTKPESDGIYGRRGATYDEGMVRASVLMGIRKEDALANKKKEVALRWYFNQLITENKELEL